MSEGRNEVNSKAVRSSLRPGGFPAWKKISLEWNYIVASKKGPRVLLKTWGCPRHPGPAMQHHRILLLWRRQSPLVKMLCHCRPWQSKQRRGTYGVVTSLSTYYLTVQHWQWSNISVTGPTTPACPDRKSGSLLSNIIVSPVSDCKTLTFTFFSFDKLTQCCNSPEERCTCFV